MRRRRLYRFSTNPMIEPRRIRRSQQDPIGPPPDQIAFERGIEHGMRLSAMQQQQIIEQERHRALALVGQNEARIARIKQTEFDRGFQAGRAAGGGSKSGGEFSYADVEAARARAYREGQSSVQKSSSSDPSKIRERMREEMLEQCRIIAESNPNMAPGVNAVRHRIRKLD